MSFEALNTLFYKDGKEVEDFQPFLVNRFVSFIDLPVAEYLNAYTFQLDTDVQFKLFDSVIKKGKVPFYRYIKKVEPKELELQFLYDNIRKYYNMSDKDFAANVKIYEELFKDKGVMEQYFRFFGVDRKRFDEYGFTFNKIKKQTWW